jgi:hypothetical protein
MSDLAKVDLLRRVTDVFNCHDLDAIMAAFSDDCVFECRAGLIPGASDSWARTTGPGDSVAPSEGSASDR